MGHRRVDVKDCFLAYVRSPARLADHRNQSTTVPQLKHSTLQQQQQFDFKNGQLRIDGGSFGERAFR